MPIIDIFDILGRVMGLLFVLGLVFFCAWVISKLDGDVTL